MKNNQIENAATASLPALSHCQNCNQYKPADDLKFFGAISACRRCRGKLESAAMAKRQQSFFDDQTMLF